MAKTEITETENKPRKKRTLFQRIVNVFLYIGLITFAISIFLFGFSQTSTFRDWLRDFVVEQANANLNGKISIGKIEGTIFTSLILRNTVVAMEKDTLLNAGLIELRTSPLKIFLKTIYVRKAEIKDTQIAFVKDSSGELNIAKLFPPSDEEEDTSKSSFPFRIEVADCNLTNVDFYLQNFDKVGSNLRYASMNMDDLRVENIFLSLKAFADIKNNSYEAKLEYLSLDPNLLAFNLESLSGEFGINPKELIVNNLNINTANSNISLYAKVNGLNIFDTTITENLRYAGIDLSLKSPKFNFDDLSSFIPPIDMLKGAAGVELNASGNLLQLDINKIILDYEKTHLETKAVIRNIDNIDEMTIAADFRNSSINQADINKLLPEVGVPSFEKLGIVKIDSLTFDGKPLNFKSKLLITASEGKLSSDIQMNLEKPIAEYDINLSTKNLNLFPIAGLSTSLNLRSNFIGKGFSPNEMSANISLVGDGSIVEGVSIDSLSLNAEAKEGIIGYSLFTSTAEKTEARIFGSLDFTQEEIGYKADGIVSNLDLGKFMQDTATVTDLNFNFKTEGQNFDLDQMNMYLTLDLSPSKINGIEIDGIRTITDIFTDNNNERVINFISDIADITLKGKYNFSEMVSALTEEASIVSDAFTKKISEILPSGDERKDLIIARPKLAANNKKELNKLSTHSIIYLIDLKDFGIISPFLRNRRLEIDGNLSGEINYNKQNFAMRVNSNLNYVKYWGDEDVYFLSKLNSDLNITNGFDAQTTKDINLDFIISTDRVFAGSDLNDVFVGVNLNNNAAKIRLDGKVENKASINLVSNVDLNGAAINFDIDTLNLNYNGFYLTNRDNLNIALANDRIDINNFRLFHSQGEILANGFLASDTEQNLDLKISNIQGKDLFKSISNGNGFSFLDINLNLRANINGNYANPVMKFEFNGNNLTFKEKEFGNLVSNFYYANKSISTDVEFFDAFSGSTLPAFKLQGTLPIDLSFTGSGKRILDDEDISFSLTSRNFDITPFGELIPGVSKFKGKLNCDLQLSGTIQEPYPDGFVKLDNSSFLLKYNNLEYKAGLKISVARDFFSLDSLLLANSDETKFGGKITGGGKAELENLNMTSSQFAFNGRLKVLGEESKYISPNLYGDLVISTNGNFDLRFDKSGANLKAPISVDIANLTYSQAQGFYSSSNESFRYKFVEDTITKNTKVMDFESLVNLSKSNEAEEIQKETKPSKFDYSIDVEVADEAVLTYVLSREFNQNLVAVLSGNFNYESIGGNPIAQGELKLLEGSTLEFIKTLSAEGKIRFESELSNPYLDITATYKNYYYPLENSSSNEGEQSSGDEIEVAVKMNIKGSLKELDKNLSQQSEKLTVYYGAKNIEDNIPDQTKDASDAVMFMLLGKFNDNVTQQERNVVSSYATSLAGSLVGGFLNRQLGDYVKSLEIRQSGTDTKFILAGRAGKFRYSIGGSTSVFQDLGLANVKIEYPITRSFFMRLERKEALSETKYINEMINELGLKYRFEF